MPAIWAPALRSSRVPRSKDRRHRPRLCRPAGRGRVRAHGPDVIGFDIDSARIAELRAGHDRTREVDAGELCAARRLRSRSDAGGARRRRLLSSSRCRRRSTTRNRPDLAPLLGGLRDGRHGARAAARSWSTNRRSIRACTEEDLRAGAGARSRACARARLHLGYSPERINPGDKEHRFETIVKVVAGQDAAALERVAAVYGSVVTRRRPPRASIKVAEAAKVIENTQRDLNIALMNELVADLRPARHRHPRRAGGGRHQMELPAASRPGLVGGHCIGVDPYYLTTEAEQLGYQPEVILAGRRDQRRRSAPSSRSEDEDADRRRGPAPARGRHPGPDLQGERARPAQQPQVPDIVRELAEFGIDVAGPRSARRPGRPRSANTASR